MKNLLFILSVLLTTQLYAQKSLKIEMYFTSLNKGEANPLQKIDVEKATSNIKWGHEIKVYPEIEYQIIEGIGGAFNEIGGEALSCLTETQQKELITNLFAVDKAGFTFCRTAIGSSDFGIDAYSYSETPEDYMMKQFSIERDQKYVLPYIKSALAINPELLLFASPWSPPAWMKQNHSMTGLTDQPNTLRKEKEIYRAYARYFVNYLQAYENEGVSIDRICIQNENDANTKYPSCVMPPAQMLLLATDYIIPLFNKNNVETRVYAGTFRTAEKLDLIEYLTMDKIDNLAGVGMQYTSPLIITDAVKMNPELKMFHTEGHCYNGQNSVEQAKHRLEEAAEYINSGLSNFCYWNMVLNETTESGWDWPQNSLININRVNKTIQYNPDYNAMYILSHFVRPGDVRIASLSKRPMISVKSPDGKIKLLIQNTDDTDSAYRLNIGQVQSELIIPANGITAIVIDNK